MGLAGLSLPPLVPRPLLGRTSGRALTLDLDLVEGRSGAVRPLPARFTLIFEGFFWVDLATVSSLFAATFECHWPLCKRCAKAGLKDRQVYLQIMDLSSFRYGRWTVHLA
jgi:hypothetical protein